MHKTPNVGALNVNGHDILTQSECIPKVNIECFGKCNANPANPKPCNPEGVWLYPCDMFEIGNDEVIYSESCMVCSCGGGVIMFDGDKQ